MRESLRDTPAGQALRFIGVKAPWLHYPEEVSGFQPPKMPHLNSQSISEPADVPDEPLSKSTSDTTDVAEKTSPKPVVEVGASGSAIIRQMSQKGLSDVIVVTWTDNDDDNPRNWSDRKKSWVMIVVSIYTFVVYCTASIITPTAETMMRRYDVSLVVSSLALSMYVLGCKYASYAYLQDDPKLTTSFTPRWHWTYVSLAD